ncbi:MAG TPA: histidine ammonia-lyase [Anaerolineales bacterium]|nr:histidine ammonia-lyase [Anaerolineales bacterium]
MIHLTGEDLTIDQVVAVARHGERVAPLSEDVQVRMRASQAWVDAAVRGRTTIYGVNTGFGPLATTSIPPEETRRLSRNLILSCLAGVGEPIPVEWARAMMAIRANSLVKGFSGVRPVVVETLMEMLNRGVTPWIPAKGSLGASGDLAPLSHMAVVLTRDPSTGVEASALRAGETEDGGYSGQAYYEGELMTGAEAMARAGLKRLVLEAKEGLALSNGTTFMAAAGALGVYDAERLLEQAELAAALSFEALLGITSALHPALHEANGQPGQMQVAANLLKLLEGSQLVDSAPHKVQDAYSLRCTPQVLGPVRDTLAFLRGRFTAAINAASDNPLIFTEIDGGHAISGGNFHGQGPAMWLDFLGIAVAEIGGISERRTFRLLDPALNGGLPAMLVPTSGLDSGLMIPQYTAAALVSDNKTLAHPDSVDSIPSSANQEDHVSMGANAARHALEIVANTQWIIAIEMITAAQGIDLRPDGPARLGKGTRAGYAMIREVVKFLDHDRATAGDIEGVVERMCR